MEAWHSGSLFPRQRLKLEQNEVTRLSKQQVQSVQDAGITLQKLMKMDSVQDVRL